MATTSPVRERPIPPPGRGSRPSFQILLVEDQEGGQSFVFPFMSLGRTHSLWLTQSLVYEPFPELFSAKLFFLNNTADGIIYTLSRAADFEEEFIGHASLVARYSLLLAQTLGIQDPRFLRELERGAFLHDIGKAGIPHNILSKRGPLTPVESEILKDHPVIGYDFLRPLTFLHEAKQVVLYHHERFDGCGYPFGLSGVSIPLMARIFSVADTLDAITSDRPYRQSRDFDFARQEIAKRQGLQFDPDVVEAFLSVPEDVWRDTQQRARPTPPSVVTH